MLSPLQSHSIVTRHLQHHLPLRVHVQSFVFQCKRYLTTEDVPAQVNAAKRVDRPSRAGIRLRLWSPDETARLDEAVKQGKTSAECVALFPMRTPPSVCIKYGQHPKCKRGSMPRAEDPQRIMDLVRQGWSALAIKEAIPHRTLRYISTTARYHGVTFSKTATTRSRNWSDAENEILLDCVQKGESAESILQALPGRTLPAIETKMRRSKSSDRYDAVRCPSRKWTEEEESKLLQMVDTNMLNHQIARILGRSYRSVEGKLDQIYARRRQNEVAT